MQNIEEKLRGKQFRFWTKNGIFSKDRIDAGTKLLIENIEVDKNDSVLDLGCGYGVIGIVLSTLTSGKVMLVDSDIRAVELARKNITENHILNAQVLISDAFSNIGEQIFDIIASYPPSHEGEATIEEFLEGARDHLKKKGKFYLVTEKRLANYFNRMLANYYKNVSEIAKDEKHTVYLVKN